MGQATYPAGQLHAGGQADPTCQMSTPTTRGANNTQSNLHAVPTASS